ncbi:glucose-1-phosphate thymidylyltransferase [Caldisphaera sp.]|uniref:glucose-1-phosphate thymidylyltransferase n=1 Tax=Caldisphaera sp. TaxID=2060322 RepID=UPI0025BDE713|nr:glucose-1-phosphate thymidylyltransferase [Caldisphaera sp.]
MQAVVLHGGQGTRLRPLTHTGPKQLIKVAGKPISQWVLEQIRDSGINDVIIILGDNNPQRVIEYYGDGSWLNLNIKYVYQGKARGIADAVYKVKNLVNDRFIVYLGDNIIPYDLKDLVKFKGDASIMLAKVNEPQRFGVAIINENKVIKVIEKPKEKISDLALIGIYGFTREIFEIIENLRPSWRGELEITDAIQSLIDKGKNVEYKIIEDWWKDTGLPEDIIEANMILLDRYANKEINGEMINSKVEGRTVIQEKSTIENSRIIGPLFIGKNSLVKNSFLGPYTMIGDNCEIIDAEIENSVVLDNAKIEDVSIRDSLIGQGSLIKKGKTKPRAIRIVAGENSRIEV